LRIFLEVGLQGNKTLRFIDLKALAADLGPLLCKAIPAFHSFTGCDQLPAFAKRAKKRPFVLLEKNPSFQRAFGEMGNDEKPSQCVIDVVEKFVCSMYGSKSVSVNATRFDIFMKKYKHKGKKPMGSVKGIDGSNMPPCHSVLVQQIYRVNHICMSWSNATVLEPHLSLPQENGWNLINGQFKPNWFEGERIPESVEEILIPSDEDSENDEVDFDSDSDYSDEDLISDYE